MSGPNTISVEKLMRLVGTPSCPWRNPRVVDRNATFLFVPQDQVEDVASRFGAAAFDMPDGFWTHRGTGCTFDTMIAELGLSHDALYGWCRDATDETHPWNGHAKVAG